MGYHPLPFLVLWSGLHLAPWHQLLPYPLWQSQRSLPGLGPVPLWGELGAPEQRDSTALGQGSPRVSDIPDLGLLATNLACMTSTALCVAGLWFHRVEF